MCKNKKKGKDSEEEGFNKLTSFDVKQTKPQKCRTSRVDLIDKEFSTRKRQKKSIKRLENSKDCYNINKNNIKIKLL